MVAHLDLLGDEAAGYAEMQTSLSLGDEGNS